MDIINFQSLNDNLPKFIREQILRLAQAL